MAHLLGWYEVITWAEIDFLFKGKKDKHNRYEVGDILVTTEISEILL